MFFGLVPNKQVLWACYVTWGSVLTIPVLFPFAGYMTVDFGMAQDPDHAGLFSYYFSLMGLFIIYDVCDKVITQGY